MNGTDKCLYETPCGWCSKWDKECDGKKYTKSHRINNPSPITSKEYYDEDKGEIITKVVETCQTDEDHTWEPCGISTVGSHYICRKCMARKVI